MKITRYSVVFEVFNPYLILQMSELLSEFRIQIDDLRVYAGRATVSGLVNTGTSVVCEVSLDEPGLDLSAVSDVHSSRDLRAGFEDLLTEWQQTYRVLPEFKVVVADLQSLLIDVRHWLDQVELKIQAAPSRERGALEREILQELGPSVVPAIDSLHERLEHVSDKIEHDWRPAHQNFAKRLLHPLMMCSPFAYRTYQKPLGYAGDYEMVNMIMRNPHEGSSLYAKIVNLWFLSQFPARAHRNRIQYLKERLIEETTRLARKNRPIRIFNLGCGPASEIQEFLTQTKICDAAQFTLVDFNEETVLHVGRVLDEIKGRLHRKTTIAIQKKSVHYILKEVAKTGGASRQEYDLVYCAGLFDYLPDSVCKQLNNILYDWLAPEGLLIATNVEACKPFRNMLEFVLDWHLIYRDETRGSFLVPERAPAQNRCVKKDPTEVNVFIEVRKPNDT